MREAGYYWVFFRDEWIVAEYDGGRWWIPGQEHFYTTNDFDSVGDAVFTPDKYRRS